MAHAEPYCRCAPKGTRIVPCYRCETCGELRNDAADCETCGGSGMVTREVMHYVTHDMALDAGEPEMEGMPMPRRWEDVCPDCLGTGKPDGDA